MPCLHPFFRVLQEGSPPLLILDGLQTFKLAAKASQEVRLYFKLRIRVDRESHDIFSLSFTSSCNIQVI